MKLTKAELKQLIKEELKRVLKEDETGFAVGADPIVPTGPSPYEELKKLAPSVLGCIQELIVNPPPGGLLECGGYVTTLGTQLVKEEWFEALSTAQTFQSRCLPGTGPCTDTITKIVELLEQVTRQENY